MGLFSAAFVWRMLDHTHAVEIDKLENRYDANGKPVGKTATLGTTAAQGHRHEVEIYPDGTGRALSTNEHEHAITSQQVGGQTVYAVSGPQGHVRARVPQYGKLRFLDRQGVEVARGISVGSEWTYRSFIEGGHGRPPSGPSAASTNRCCASDAEGQVLPLELIVRVFRTYKGNIENGIQGSMQLRNPDNSKHDERPVDLHGQGRVDQ